MSTTTKTLDLGCGLTPRNPFNATEAYGIDLREDAEAGVLRADLVVEPIPFPDDAFDFITAFDFIEHVPRVLYLPQRRNPFVELMNEIHRALKPGGIFLSVTPAFPNPSVFQDPTHVNFITEETFPCYFDHERRWATAYGFKGSFIVLKQEWQGGKLQSFLRKV
jgi:SAM-dependent methyltransferase